MKLKFNLKKICSGLIILILFKSVAYGEVKKMTTPNEVQDLKSKIVQVGDPVLRQVARPLSKEEILSPAIQQLILLMKNTMRDAPGVGLAAPQIGLPLQLAVIEDREEYLQNLKPEEIKERDRSPVPFQVIINPVLTVVETDKQADFYEGCLRLDGFMGSVSRALKVKVDALNERGQAIHIEAHGWYARILQHEIDHLNGVIYIDRMRTRTFTSIENYKKFQGSHLTR